MNQYMIDCKIYFGDIYFEDKLSQCYWVLFQSQLSVLMIRLSVRYHMENGFDNAITESDIENALDTIIEQYPEIDQLEVYKEKLRYYIKNAFLLVKKEKEMTSSYIQIMDKIKDGKIYENLRTELNDEVSSNKYQRYKAKLASGEVKHFILQAHEEF